MTSNRPSHFWKHSAMKGMREPFQTRHPLLSFSLLAFVVGGLHLIIMSGFCVATKVTPNPVGIYVFTTPVYPPSCYFPHPEPTPKKPEIYETSASLNLGVVASEIDPNLRIPRPRNFPECSFPDLTNRQSCAVCHLEQTIFPSVSLQNWAR